MSRPLFLLLTYCQQAFVAEAVSAALRQSGPELDILISDDCSRDGTFETIKHTVAEYRGPHRVFVQQTPKNLGLNAHINYCISATDAEIIIYGAGDDCSKIHRSERTLEAFARTEAKLVHSQVELIDVAGRALPEEKSAALHTANALTQVATSLTMHIGATGAWHRSLFEKYGPLPNVAFEDLVLGFRASLEDAAVFIDEPLVRYRTGIGISATEKDLTSKLKWRAARGQRLRLYEEVFETRLQDAQTFGYSENDAVLSLLRDAAKDQRLRQQVLEEGFVAALGRAVLETPKALQRWVSERSRERRALRRS